MIIIIPILCIICITQAIYIHHINKQLLEWLDYLKSIKIFPEQKNFIKNKGLLAEINFKMNDILSENRKQFIKLTKAEDTNRQILTNLSHDIRTPLASLIGYLEALYEIEQMADIIGVMQEGKLIKEIDMNILHKQNKKYVEFEVSNVNAAALVLEHDFNISNYTIIGNQLLRIFEAIDIRANINSSFIQNGIIVTNINVYEEKLENYFKNLIGSVGIE